LHCQQTETFYCPLMSHANHLQHSTWEHTTESCLYAYSLRMERVNDIAFMSFREKSLSQTSPGHVTKISMSRLQQEMKQRSVIKETTNVIEGKRF